MGRRPRARLTHRRRSADDPDVDDVVEDRECAPRARHPRIDRNRTERRLDESETRESAAALVGSVVR
jgi:hypothetical protein